MSEEDLKTLAAIKLNFLAGVATLDEIILAVFRLGEYTGSIRMAKAGQEQMAELLRKAA